MVYRYNETLTWNSQVCKKWTQSAIDCYNIGCQCSKCGLYHLIFKNSESKCVMKHTVIELVRKIGIPGKESQG